LSIDGNAVLGSITAIPQDKLEVEIALYENRGRLIPTLEIIIDLKVLIDLIDRRIVAIDKDPTKFKTETAIYLFNPNRNDQVPALDMKLNHSPRKDLIKLTEEQIVAISASLKQKLTIIWGPPGTGKTKTLQGIIAELLSNGQKILFASNTNNAIDGLLKGLIDNPPYTIFDELKSEGKIVRIGSQTNSSVKEVFGSWEVAQQKSHDIQSEIINLQEIIDTEQIEFKLIQDEIKQFEYAQRLHEEIIKMIERQKSINASHNLEEKKKNITYSKNKIIGIVNISKNVKDIVIKIESVAEGLKNQRIKVAGINTIVFKTKTTLEKYEAEEYSLTQSIESLENAFFSFMRHKKEIEDLKSKRKLLLSNILELKSSFEVYKLSQKTEITIESELTGEFFNTLTKLRIAVSKINLDINVIQNYFKELDLVLKLEEQKPFWISLGEEDKIISTDIGDAINEFVSMSSINQENITKKYEQSIDEIQQQIEKNEYIWSLLETELKKCQKEFVVHTDLFLKPDSYWNEKKEVLNQILYFIEPIQSQLNSLNEKLLYIEKNVIKEAKLICCTLVKSSYDETLAEGEFDTLVVDETSMVLLPQLYCTAALVKERIILCGDHLQLQPISTSQSKIALKWLASSYYDFIELNGEISTESDEETSVKGNRVERVVVLKKLNEYQSNLSLQHRMPPKVADLIRPWYKKAGNDLKDNYKIPDDFKQFHLNGHFLSAINDIFFIDTTAIRTYHSRTSDRSPYNLINAAIVAEITRDLVENYKIDLKNIRCISPYRAQYQLTSALLLKFLPNEYKEMLFNVASSVHKMQGGEAPIIFYDLTDGCQGGFTGFLKTKDFHIHNVAISRSQFKLIFVGDLKKLQKLRDENPSPAFNDILQYLNSATIIDAKPIKEKIFKQFSETDLINENALSLSVEQRNSLIILPSQLYYKFLEDDIRSAKYSILFVSPFVTKPRWNKLKEAIRNFKTNTDGDGVITIITRPPDKMFGGDQINMSAVEVLNEFVKQGFKVMVSPKIHSKLVVIDRGRINAIAYWGSLNPLSFNDTDEINTRLADQEIAEQLVNMSLIGNIYPYKENSLDRKMLPKHTIVAVRKQFNEFRWVLAGYYGRPLGAICSNETIEKIIELLPANRTEYKMIPQFNRKNFVLWNHLDEIAEITSPLREFHTQQYSLFTT
jgi:hypothetical protein